MSWIGTVLWTLVKAFLMAGGLPLLITICVWSATVASFAYTYTRLRLWAFLVFHLVESGTILLAAGVNIRGALSRTAMKDALPWTSLLVLFWFVWAFVECIVLGLPIDDNNQWGSYPKRGKNWWGKRQRCAPPLIDITRALIFWAFAAFVIVQISMHGFMASWLSAKKIFFWIIGAAGCGFIDEKLKLVQWLADRLAHGLDPKLFGFVLTEGQRSQPKLPFGGANEATVDEIREAGLL